jgi:hypothetical protein
MVELDRGDMEQYVDSQSEQSEKEKEGFWAALAGWDKPFLVFVAISLLSALAALFVLVTPLLDLLLGFMGLHYAGWIQWESWLMGADRGLFVVAAFALNALVFALLARYRIRRDYSVYYEAGCPQCHEHELIRVRRNHRDRSLSFLGVPVRRYSCRNCTWHGVRLAGYRYTRPADKMEEIDAGGSESAAESFSGAEVSTEELSIQAPPVVPMEAVEVRVEDFAETSSVEIAEHPIASDEPALIENSDDIEGMVSPMFVAETTENFELNAETLDSLLVREPGIDEGEDQSDMREKVADSEADSTIGAEDDEFARLCLEVAQSKQ